MRIGIITVPLVANYGGLLQAYALQTVLQRLGHEVIFLDRKPNRWNIKYYRYPFSILKRVIKKYILGNKSTQIFLEKNELRAWPIISQYTQNFIDKNINSKIVTNFKKINENDFDALIAGSDQVWRPQYYPQIEDAYFAFAENWKNIKRIAYAASFGSNKWEYNDVQTKRCRELAKKIDCITVREVDGINLCRDHLDIKATHVLDPTMLLNMEDYESLYKNFKDENNGDLFSYVLDTTPEIEKNIKEYANIKEMKIFCFNSKVDISYAKLEERIQKPVELWLKGFKQASLVITDSFHACVFSIIFNKSFAVIGNKKRGMARFKSLLSIFNLDDRLVENFNDIYNLNDIDWDSVNRKRKRLAKKSIDILKDNLNY